jgi:hypothetical protein
MSRPEETLERLAALSREDQALAERLPEELTAPLSDEKQSALVSAIEARLAAQRNGASKAPKVELSTSAAAPPVRRIAALGGGALALAAALLLWLGRPLESPAVLPIYVASVAGAVQGHRGNDEAKPSLKLRSGSMLRFDARPAIDFDEPVGARVFVVSGDGAPVRLTLDQERSASGALKVAARLPPVLPAHGEVVLLVGRKSTLENTADPRSAGARDPQRFAWPFERVP